MTKKIKLCFIILIGGILLSMVFTYKKRAVRSDEYFINFFEENKDDFLLIAQLEETNDINSIKYENKRIIYEFKDSTLEEKVNNNVAIKKAILNIFSTDEINGIFFKKDYIVFNLSKLSNQYRGNYIYCKEGTYDHTFRVTDLRNGWYLEILPNV